MKFLIDGYNLIFECGLHGKRVNSHSLANARETLLRMLQSRIESKILSEITIVFDAKRQPLSGQQERETFGEIEVLYSINYLEADEMIEALIKKHATPKQLLVVSSDHRIQKAAIRRKAKTIDSGDWYDQIIDSNHSRETIQTIQKAEFSEESQRLLTDDDLAKFKEDVDQDLGNDNERW